MLTFKQYLQEANVPYGQKPLEPDELVATIKERCSEALRGPRLWRGSQRSAESNLSNPATGTRQSAGTQNYYTMLLDTNSKNAGWPKRSKSFICSTNQGHASTYASKGGTTFMVFPVDGTDIGQVNQIDIWICPIQFRGDFSKKRTINEMQEFWEHMHGVFKDRSWTPTMEEAVSFYRKVNPKAFIRELQQLYLYSRDEVVPEETAQQVLDSFCDELPAAYSYDRMGCELKKPGTVDDKHTEVWFSGPCVLVANADRGVVSKELGL